MLDEVVVRLERNAEGQTNWQALSGALGAETGNATSQTLALREIGGIELRNARIYWDDMRAGSTYKFSAINVRTGRLAPDTPFELAVDFTMLDAHEAPTYRFRLHSTAIANTTTQRYQMRKATLELGLPQGGQAALIAELNLDMANQLFHMPVFDMRANGFRMTGAMQGSGIRDNPAFSGEFNIVEFSPRELLQVLGQPVPQSADEAVLMKASAVFGLTAGRDQITLKPLFLQLDDSVAKGGLTVRDLAAPRVEFALDVDGINMDRYLPPPDMEPALGGGAPWPFAYLRGLDMDGDLHIGRLQAFSLSSVDVRLTVKTRGNEVRVDQTGVHRY
jgi:AsmA protein